MIKTMKDVLLLPRLLKRIVVVFALLFIFTQHFNNENNTDSDTQQSKLYCFVASCSVILWFMYDAHRCQREYLHCVAAREKDSTYLKVASKVMNMVCNYDPRKCSSIERFKPVISKSKCLFAKASTIWGNCDYVDGDTLESNVSRSVPTLLQMLLRGEDEGIDGFLFEVRSSPSCHGFDKDVNKLSQAVKRVLEVISDLDPDGARSARKSYIGDKAWHFTFAGFPIFVTTFAGCYDKTSSRYTYLADSQSAFVLLQPEYSFLHHDIPFDTPHTEWDNPVTIRDRIRKSFADAGQKYTIPDTVHYPASEHIVKSLDGKSVVRWWDTKSHLVDHVEVD